ncbi:hypothetical protein BTO20_07980 [Mycobacterium dioxanotrophicus]|jgi:serine/threonine-protein kinase|uniref:SMP-30/Gluconolactonase/LRE-like region domain-containing protein n=1 Tax=Mycobacterium dioxanotrophicus TaxID=482462 RepID=A0A1Y0C048_9MYCO|nr:NHL repeat-containing protein [Mycobacterium dioxanotrophicus]ART68522.1 hypothetical protein BTO20_07980 [Mycobacterium dioxanotrophicus]
MGINRARFVGLVAAALLAMMALAAPAHAGPRQEVLPIHGLTQPGGIAVDGVGTVYVVDTFANRVLELTSGANSPTALPIPDLTGPEDVAVDAAGDVFVTDRLGRVWTLPAGTASPRVLPFGDLGNPAGVAVDTAGNVYVTDRAETVERLHSRGDVDRVWKLAPGANAPTALPFPGLHQPDDVAVDAAGDVYVLADTGDVTHPAKGVLKLAPGASTPTLLPFTDVSLLGELAVDTTGDVYVTGEHQVYELAPGADTPTPLPFTGLSEPSAVAVADDGSVVVTDGLDKRVLRLIQG